MKRTLHQRREGPDSRYYKTVQWKRGLPFLHNPRGVLIHRVRSACTHVIRGKPSHDTADYWCGNGGRGAFVSEPPVGRLVCAACEAAAVAHGEPTADEIVGRHVCVGRVRAYSVCKCKRAETGEDN